MTESPLPARVWTQHVIDPCVCSDRLPPCIEPASSDLRLAHISDARRATTLRVLESCRGEITDALALGAVGWESEGRRRVLLWDLMEVSVSREGTDMRVAWPEHGEGMGRRIPSADLSLPISPYGWYTAFDPVLFRAWRAHGLDTDMLAGPTGEWMRQTLRRTFRHCVDWNRLRRSVLAYLRLDPLVLSLTRRIFEGTRASIDSFNWVDRHARELAHAGIEHPRLLRFLQFASRLDAGSPLANLESLLHTGGITPSARRKLEAWGFGCFAEATESAPFRDCERVVAEFANLLDRLEVQDEPPAVFARLAFGLDGELEPDWFLRALLEELRSLEEEGLADMPPFAYEDAAAWLASGPREPDENQRRAGWAWIESRAELFAMACGAEALYPWPVPCETFECGPWRVVPIRNDAELAEEARAMHNCLLTLAHDCAAGRRAVFSVREAEGGRRVACFALARIGRSAFWQLTQVAGPCNAQVAPSLMEPAAMAVRRCTPCSTS